MNNLSLDQFVERAGDAAKLLRTLANEQRLLILCHLGDGERSVSDLGAELDLSQSALSQHLARLRADDIVATRRAGQTILYRIKDANASRILLLLRDIFCPLPQSHGDLK